MGKLAQYSKKIQKEREERAVRMKGAVMISLNCEEYELREHIARISERERTKPLPMSSFFSSIGGRVTG
jgi:hypothetical protein